jgi:hypothetical protein
LYNDAPKSTLLAMAPNSKDGRAMLQEPLATEMAAFRAAMGMGTTEIGVIRDAVRAFIQAKIHADDKLKARYEVELAQRLARHPIRLVKPESGTNGK